MTRTRYFQVVLAFPLVMVAALLNLPIPSTACTVFNSAQDGNVLFGNVENNLPGLCFDVAGLPDHPIETQGKKVRDLMAYLLNKCATVQDALDFFRDYYWVGHSVNHLMVMDKTGESAIVEHIGSTIYIFHKEGQSQVMTNYSIANPEIRYGEYPCPRFLKAHEMLDTMGLNVANMQKVCEAVSHAYYEGLYANIFDPNSLEIYLFNPNTHSPLITFSLTEEMDKGNHHLIMKDHQIISGQAEQKSPGFLVSANAPNPFGRLTSFSIEIFRDAEIGIRIIDPYGRVLEVLENKIKSPGHYTYTWHASPLPSGTYYCRICMDGLVETRKWVKHR